MNNDNLRLSGSYYELLGVSHSADAVTLRKAFRNLSKALHPDTTSLPADQAARKFQQVCEAYDLLADPICREAYDRSIAEASSSVTTPLINHLNLYKPDSRSERSQEVRRPLSGGELFSLFLLGLAIFISLLLGIGFALADGRDLQVRPSWLIVDQNLFRAPLEVPADAFTSSS